MRKKVCVHGDIATGTCASHDGTINVTGTVVAPESYCTIDKKNVALHGDIVVFNCGHTGICVGTSQKMFVKNKMVVRDGDAVVAGTGQISAIITASLSKCEGS